MPPKRRSSPTARSSYESDNGFVEDAPRSKKPKTSTTGKSTKDAKKTGGAAGGAAAGADGEIFWELSGKRRVGVSEFKGNTMVNIREYYEKDGGMLPGKKGISLPIEQFNTLVKLIPHIEAALSEKGEKIARPDYSGAARSLAATADADDDDEEEQEPEAKAKKNFEETSDEE